MPEQTAEKESEWTDAELEAAVKSYLWMLEQEKNGKPYNKSAVNKTLRDGILARRSRGSIEYRMENISAALLELCLPWIEGYKPHGNIGQGVKKRIIGILDEIGFVNSEDFTPTAERKTLDERTHKLIKRTLVGEPSGNPAPRRADVTSCQYVRDPMVKAWVLQHASGKCEMCGQPAPFMMKDGTPYLEVHHVVSLSDGGPDKIDNAVALCPNCHKRCHLSGDYQEANVFLYENIKRLVRISAGL